MWRQVLQGQKGELGSQGEKTVGAQMPRWISAAAQRLKSGAEASTSDQTPAECLQQAVTQDVAGKLIKQGFAVVDGVFGPEICRSLKAEIQVTIFML